MYVGYKNIFARNHGEIFKISRGWNFTQNYDSLAQYRPDLGLQAWMFRDNQIIYLVQKTRRQTIAHPGPIKAT